MEGLQVYDFAGAAMFLALMSDFSGIAAALSRGSGLELAAALLTVGVICTLAANVLSVASSRYISVTQSSIWSSVFEMGIFPVLKQAPSTA